MQGDDVVVDKTTIHFEAYENNPQLQRYTSSQLAVLDKFSDVTYTINGKALTNNEVTLLLHVILLQSSAKPFLNRPWAKLSPCTKKSSAILLRRNWWRKMASSSVSFM